MSHVTKKIQQKYDKESEQCNLFGTPNCFVLFKEKILLRNVFPHLSFPPKPSLLIKACCLKVTKQIMLEKLGLTY